MKKFSVLIVLALLAVAGTGYAVTCAYDNVPAATLLVPYWKVSLNGATDVPIPPGGVDTLVSIVNVSTPGVIAHVTVWNKYSKAVIDFNIPLTGKDTVSFSMRDIMNGKLSPNFPQYGIAPYLTDPCGLLNPGLATVKYVPSIGWGSTQFIRFSHPDAISGTNLGTDVVRSISQYNGVYNTATGTYAVADAIGGLFRPTVWHSLDQSGDVTAWTASSGTNILDSDNPQCGWAASDSSYKADLSGYLTIDVVNYCTNFFPDQPDFYDKDAIATAGWAGAGFTYTPNCLIGDVFYVDSAANGGNISGDPAVPIEFDIRLPFTGGAATPVQKTFFGKFVASTTPTQCGTGETTGVGCTIFPQATYAPGFVFAGDGREPLGDHYGFRYLANSAQGFQSWIEVWRSDMYLDPVSGLDVNLCAWADPTAKIGNAGSSGSGLYDSVHQVTITTYDNDENVFQGTGIPPGPSGQGTAPTPNTYIFLESQRISLISTAGWNPQGFTGGWADMTLRGPGYDGLTEATGFYNMGWVGVQHTAPGAFLSVGYAASNLNNQMNCQPVNFFTAPGTEN